MTDAPFTETVWAQARERVLPTYTKIAAHPQYNKHKDTLVHYLKVLPGDVTKLAALALAFLDGAAEAEKHTLAEIDRLRAGRDALPDTIMAALDLELKIGLTHGDWPSLRARVRQAIVTVLETP